MTTMSIGFGADSGTDRQLHDAAALLADLESHGVAAFAGRLEVSFVGDELAHELLRKVSTCEAGCGCTVYSPKTDCPEPSCPCLILPRP